MPLNAPNNQPPDELIVLCSPDHRIRFVSRSFAAAFGAPVSAWLGKPFDPGGEGGTDGPAPRRYRTRADVKGRQITIAWEESRLESGERLYAGVVDGAALSEAPPAQAPEPAGVDTKMRFLATMSHEMRTPLNGILGMNALLLDTELSANQRAYAEAVRESGAALLALINDILDYSKLQSGKFELEEGPFDPVAMVESVTELLSTKAVDKRIELAAFVAPDMPARLIGDEARLRQILINLAGNGVKFTNEGGVAIEAACDALAGGEVELRVAIRDTGIGIPFSEQQAIFDEFAQANNAAVLRPEGTGLGLAISRRLVAAMGGEITLKSAPGKGSTFTFTARLASAAPADAPAHVDVYPVVVATASTTLARVLRLQLQSFGVHKFRFVENAAEALVALPELPGATLLSDLSVAEIGGAALADAADRALVLLADSDRGAIAELRAKNFDGYLIKPIRRATLMRELARAPHVQPEVRITEAKAVPTISRKLKILLAEDNQINAVLATALIKRAGHQVRVAGNGQEAVDAVLEADFDMIFMDMHMPEMDGLDAA